MKIPGYILVVAIRLSTGVLSSDQGLPPDPIDT
jgi:hypothetical protein